MGAVGGRGPLQEEHTRMGILIRDASHAEAGTGGRKQLKWGQARGSMRLEQGGWMGTTGEKSGSEIIQGQMPFRKFWHFL